jgi:hypothetical protein
VVGIYTAGVADTLTGREIAKVGGGDGIDPAVVERMIAGMAMLRRAPRARPGGGHRRFLPRLPPRSRITGTIVNVTCGLLPG